MAKIDGAVQWSPKILESIRVRAVNVCRKFSAKIYRVAVNQLLIGQPDVIRVRASIECLSKSPSIASSGSPMKDTPRMSLHISTIYEWLKFPEKHATGSR